jgi:hypothetical protein
MDRFRRHWPEGCAVAGRPLHRFLSDDHARLDALLGKAMADPRALDLAAYAAFRGGLLRHIGMEERILFRDAQRRRGGAPLPLATRLRADHSALAALLVPTPTHALLATVRAILDEHNRLEEGPGGPYEACDLLAADDAQQVVAALQAAPEVRQAPHFDGPLAHEHIARLLEARRRWSSTDPDPRRASH